MFRVKICGITHVQDGLQAVAAGADAVGLNFFTGSRRYVAPQIAREIVLSLPPGSKKVGVFVNAAADEVRELARLVGLDVIQLHGDEPPELIAELSDWPVVRAFRLDARGWEPCCQYIDRCQKHGALPSALLVDGFQTGEYGGTGTLPDWTIAAKYHEVGIGLPLLLAGGLRYENVAAAIAAVQPYGVDTASGVESSPGRKDAAKVAAFVAAARRALGLAELDYTARGLE